MRKRGSVLTDALMVLELKGLKTQKTEEAKTIHFKRQVSP